MNQGELRSSDICSDAMELDAILDLRKLTLCQAT